MKIVRFESVTGITAPGIAENDTVISLESICSSFRSLFQLMIDDKNIMRKMLDYGPRYSKKNIILRAPIDQTTRIYAVAANYEKHASEMGVNLPEQPLIFNKLAQSMIGPDEEILLPAYSEQVDYEGELAVVMGKEGFSIPRSDAMAFVGGYTCFNDITARDHQWTALGKHRIIDWFSSKMMDKSTPLGPWIVTAENIPDPHNLRLQTRVNERTVQDESTARMVFKIPALIEYISSRVTLYPGDIIATGTPFGVGGYDKPIILQQGDTMEVEIEKLGTLRNRCR